MAENYVVRVTAGSSYDITTHKLVPVNTSTPTIISNDFCTAELNVRVQKYRGLPLSSPTTSPYFELPQHKKNKDAYSIGFRFTPKKNVNGNDLVFGNDFDHSIKDRLPPFFDKALKLVKYVIDPGLDGDVLCEKPYLYGPAASSVNTLWVGGRGGGEPEMGDNGEGMIVEEGGDEDGMEVRKESGVPAGEAARRKWFLNESRRKEWEWEAGRTYACDFFNSYLDFNDFALRLPGGWSIPIMKYWDGQGLRYVLKNRATGDVLLIVLFTLYLKEDVDEHGNVKEGVEGGMPFDLMDESRAEKLRALANGETVPEVHGQEHHELVEVDDGGVD